MAERDGDAPVSYTTNEQTQASVRRIALVLLALGLAAAYWAWPSGVTDQTMASVTVGELLRALGSVAVAVAVAVASCVMAAMLWN